MPRRGAALRDPAAWREWFLHRRRLLRFVLIAGLVVGPVIATIVTALVIADRPTDVVVEAEPPSGATGLAVRATIREVDPFRGEVQVQLVATPLGAVNDGGQFAREVTLLVNDATGATVRTFAPGSTPAAQPVVLSLSGSRPVFYPRDEYDTLLALVASTADDPQLPISLEVVNASSTFVVEQVGEPEEPLTGAALQLSRPLNVQLWALFLAAIWWAMAIASVSIVWQVVMWHEEVQFWIYGFYIGVLFALPQMRDALPGAPPRGSLIDYAAFYWAIGIVAICLILVVVVWNRRLRDAREERSAASEPAPPGQPPP